MHAYSRLVVDPERFPDDSEPAAAYGRGAVYTRTCTGTLLRQEPLTNADPLLDTYFRPYATAVSELVTDRIAARGRAVIIDVHSYPPRPSGFKDPTLARPALCLGTNLIHTTDWLTAAARRAFHPLGDIVENEPYAGCYVPLDRYGHDQRAAVMIELRRDTYLPGHGRQPGPGRCRAARHLPGRARRRRRGGRCGCVNPNPARAAPRTCAPVSPVPPRAWPPPAATSTHTPNRSTSSNASPKPKPTTPRSKPCTTPHPVDDENCRKRSTPNPTQRHSADSGTARVRANDNAPSKPTPCAEPRRPGTIIETKEPTAMTSKEPMTQQRREAFWRTYGWTPDLPETERRTIEEYWTDTEIKEAQHLGF